MPSVLSLKEYFSTHHLGLVEGFPALGPGRRLTGSEGSQELKQFPLRRTLRLVTQQVWSILQFYSALIFSTTQVKSLLRIWGRSLQQTFDYVDEILVHKL